MAIIAAGGVKQSGSSSDLQLISTKDAIVKLGDSAGSDSFKITDSSDASQFTVDSDGNTRIYNDLVTDGTVVSLGHDVNDSRLERKDLNTLSCKKKDSLNYYVLINGEMKSLASDIECVVGSSAVNTITSTGVNSSVSPSASTLYDAYLANSLSTYANGELRLSATSPTNKYLATSGNGANWRHMGAVYLDASKQIVSSRQIAGYQSDLWSNRISSTLTYPIGTIGIIKYFTLDTCVFLPGKVKFTAFFSQKISAGAVDYNVLYLYAGNVALCSPSYYSNVGNSTRIVESVPVEYTSTQNIDVELGFYRHSNRSYDFIAEEKSNRVDVERFPS